MVSLNCRLSCVCAAGRQGPEVRTEAAKLPFHLLTPTNRNAEIPGTNPLCLGCDRHIGLE